MPGRRTQGANVGAATWASIRTTLGRTAEAVAAKAFDKLFATPGVSVRAVTLESRVVGEDGGEGWGAGDATPLEVQDATPATNIDRTTAVDAIDKDGFRILTLPPKVTEGLRFGLVRLSSMPASHQRGQAVAAYAR